MPMPTNRAEFRCETESSYDGTPTLGVGTVIYLESFSSTVSHNMKPRNGMSPFAPGFKPYPTLTTGEFSGQCFISPVTLTVGTERPTIEPILRMVGFEAAAAATPSGSKTVTYNMRAHGQGSAALKHTEYDSTDAETNTTTMTGCRAQGTIKLVGDGAGTIDFAGQAATTTKTGVSGSPPTLTYAGDCPIVGGAGTVTLTELGGDAVASGLLHDAEFTFYPVSPANGLGARVINMRPAGGGMEANLTLEQESQSDWDPYAFALAKTAVNMHIALPAPAAGGDSVEFDALLCIMDVSSEDGPAGNLVWSLSCIVIFPEVGSDGGGIAPVEDVFSITYRTTDP